MAPGRGDRKWQDLLEYEAEIMKIWEPPNESWLTDFRFEFDFFFFLW